MTRSFNTFIRVLLTSGSVLALGVLAFSGMWIISPTFSYAIAAFFAAAIIEGEVNYVNIDQALLKLFSKNYLELTIAARELKKLVEDSELINHSNFLKEYKKHLLDLEYLKQHHESQEAALAAAEEELQRKQKLYLQHIYGHTPTTILEVQISFLANKEKCQEILNEIRLKSVAMKVSWLLIILTGVASGFGTAAACYESIGTLTSLFQIYLHVTLGATAIYSIIIPIAIIASIAYVLIVYNTISEMIANDTLRNWFVAFKEHLRFKENDTTTKWLLRCFFSIFIAVIIAAIVGFATVATGGTWWKLTQNGAGLFAFFSKAADFIRNITVPAYTFTTFIFNFFNAYKSAIMLIVSKIKNVFAEKINALVKTYREENWLQFINPFRFIIKVIEIPTRTVAFIGHVVSMGLTANNLDGVSPIIVTGAVGLQEVVSDANYFMEEDPKKIQNYTKQISPIEEGHSHEHSDVPGVLLKICLWWLFLLSAAWEWAASRIISGSKYTPTFDQAFSSYYGFKNDKPAPKSASSSSWKKQDLLLQLDEKREELEQSMNPFYNDEITRVKCQGLSDLRQYLASNLDLDNAPEQTLENGLNQDSGFKKQTGEAYKISELLGLHRNIFSAQPNGTSKSDDLIKEIRAACVRVP